MPNLSRPGSTTTAHPTVRLLGGGDKCVTKVKTAIRLPKEGTTVGTRYVRSPHACGIVQELTHELKHYRWDILGQMDRVSRNYHGRGTQDLVLRKRLETLVWVGIHCTERSCR